MLHARICTSQYRGSRAVRCHFSVAASSAKCKIVKGCEEASDSSPTHGRPLPTRLACVSNVRGEVATRGGRPFVV